MVGVLGEVELAQPARVINIVPKKSNRMTHIVGNLESCLSKNNGNRNMLCKALPLE